MLEYSRRQYLLYFLALLNLCLVFAAAFPSLSGLWDAWQQEAYSHGILIPPLSIMIGWHLLTEKKPVLSFGWGGVFLVLMGMGMIAISRLSAFEPPSHYGLIVSLIGISWAYFGRKLTWVLAPAFIYLFFAVPLPRLIYVTLSADMQLWSSSLGVLILRFLGVSVFQNGNVIDLGNYQLQVVEACNGLRYLFPLMSFSFLMALLLEDKMWKRVILFLSAIPLTISMNALRIAIVGITVNLWGVELAEGTLHDFEGWVFFTICVLVLFAEMKFLMICCRSKKMTGRFRLDYFGLARGRIVSGEANKLSATALTAFVISLFAAGFFVSGVIDNRSEIIPVRPQFYSFPKQLDLWHGKESRFDTKTLTNLKPTDYFIADYTKAEDDIPVNLYVAYYESQRVGTSIHSPSNCLPGSGWRIETKKILPVAIGKQTIPVTRMLAREGQRSLLIYYWFDGRGRILNDQYEAKWYLFVDSMTKHRTDGALVRLTTAVGLNEKEGDADQRIRDLISVAYPSIKRYVP